MKKLPTEVFGEIFVHLHLNDKLECMLVCQYWKQLLEEFFLYHTFCIFSLEKQNCLIKKLQEKPELAYQIERLVISYEIPKVDLSVLLSLFPKIKMLSCSLGEGNDLNISKGVKYPWSQQIEYIYDSKIDSITYQMLLSNTYPNLTTLSTGDYAQIIIPLLKNTPALKCLTLSCGIISINDLELVHQNAPSLQTLIIDNVEIVDWVLEKAIEPSHSVTECTFVNIEIEIFEIRMGLLLYLYKKYPKLSKLDYKVIDTKASNKNRRLFSENGWIPLFQKLGPQLKALGVCNSDYRKKFFGDLDKHDVRIENLKLWKLPLESLKKLERSQQIYYIQNLVLNDMEILGFEWLKELCVLKKLKISFSRQNMSSMYNINLPDLLDSAPPTLKSLSFHSLTLVTYSRFDGTSNIENLSFCFTHLLANMDGYISSYFPKLLTLKVKHCMQVGKIFNLPKLNLLSFRFTEYNKHKNSNITVLTLHNNEQHCYSVKNTAYTVSLIKEVKPFVPPMKFLPVNGLYLNSLFSLICNSLKSIAFN